MKSTLTTQHGDYPNTYREFVKMFPDDAACAAFLAKLRWPEEFTCRSCKTTSTPWNQSRGRLVCPICRYQTSVTAGTIFDKTRTPLTTWFEAAWHVTTAKNGMSAKTLERTIGTSYKVAWMLLQRFRVAMVNSERKPLSGIVEVDETYIGGKEHGGKRGRGTIKSIVVIAIEIKQPKGFGRVRMRCIPDLSGDSLLPFVQDVVAPESIVCTDGWRGYNGLPKCGYTRDMQVLSSSGDPAHVSMPGVHRVASLVKRWILGTHQGSVLPNHLQSYLEEYTFRFNRRTSRSRGLVFRRLLEQAVTTNSITMGDITGGYDWDHNYF
ncbi:MAG: IS1595 family transposase [Syntrophales bacterium]|nr:IS1595 family transposase [Syntrophales bacterium]